MHRHNSKESVGSIESTHGTGKKQMPTHMIIQREDNNELFLLPVTHLVNASVTRIKPNETATFKLDLNSRKQDRGVVLSYGQVLLLIHIALKFFFVQDRKTFVQNKCKFCPCNHLVIQKISILIRIHRTVAQRTDKIKLPRIVSINQSHHVRENPLKLTSFFVSFEFIF